MCTQSQIQPRGNPSDFSVTPGIKAGLHFTAAFILAIFSKTLSQEQRQTQANILPISEFTGNATTY